MPNIHIPFVRASLAQRNFAYACAITHGYNPCDTVFWNLFMTKPISDDAWFDDDGIVRAIVTRKFPDGFIEIPEGFNKWQFDGTKWVSY